MSKIFAWFSKKNNLPTPREHSIESLIVQKRIKEYSACLQNKTTRTDSIQRFFQVLSSILDDDYISDLCELISKKSGLKSTELSTIITKEVSNAIHGKDFDLCEKILRLPFRSLQISLPTYDFIQLIHKCENYEKLINCLSILIEKNLPYDSEYISWILITLFEQYRLGDENIIEYILNMKKNIHSLFTCYGNNNVTPLMLFLHLYGNPTCRALLDHYISNIPDQSLFLQCDKWNRSYLTHLLCGHCQHELIEPSSDITSSEQLMTQCPDASHILLKFSMLYKLGNKCDTLVKTILTSEYCFPVRLIILNYLFETDPSIELKLDEFFQNFPTKFISTYTNYLKQFIKNRNLNATLVPLLLNRRNQEQTFDHLIKFLLQQGARIHDITPVYHIILGLLLNHRSTIPFLLLDYSLYINIPYATWSNRNTSQMNLYICRVIHCGYPSEFREKFEDFKKDLSQQTIEMVEKFIDLKTPTRLSKLCFQKLRSSLNNLSDETIDKLKESLPIYLRRGIVHYGYDECYPYFHSVLFSK